MPPLAGDRLTEAQRQAADAFAAARGCEVFGPYVPLLRSPDLMSRAREVGDYLRFGSALPPRLSEFVILMTARVWTQQYEWSIHHPIALAAGLAPEVAGAIADGSRPRRMTEDEEVLYDFCAELHGQRSVSDATYERAVTRFGEQGVIDTIGLCGFYAWLAMVLNVARTPLPEGRTPELDPFPR